VHSDPGILAKIDSKNGIPARKASFSKFSLSKVCLKMRRDEIELCRFIFDLRHGINSNIGTRAVLTIKHALYPKYQIGTPLAPWIMSPVSRLATNYSSSLRMRQINIGG